MTHYNNLYNLNSLDEFSDNLRDYIISHKFIDSNGLVLSENLTKTDPRLIEKKYPENTFMNSGISIDNSGGDASRIESLRIEGQGDFVVGGDRSDNNAKISLTAENSLLSVKDIYAYSDWTKKQVRKAQLQNINFTSQVISKHQAKYMRKLDAIGLVGLEVTDNVTGAKGLLNSGDFTATAAANTIENLVSTSPQDGYNAISDLIIAQRTAVAGTPEYIANKVIMPYRVYTVLERTILDTAAGSSTILTALKANYPDVQFLYTYRADTIANNGQLAASATVAFNTGADSMIYRIPNPLEVSEIIQTGGFTFEVESTASVAGLDVLEPATGRILTGL